MNKKDRREFLKQAGTGALGIGAILAGLANSDKVFAKLYSRYSREHIEELMLLIRSSRGVFGADSFLPDLYARMANSVEEIPGIQDTIDRLIEYFDGVSIPSGDGVGVMGLPKAESDALVGGYLAILEKLSTGVSTNEIGGFVPRIPDWLGSLEPSFFADYAQTLQREMASSRGLTALMASGQEHLQGVLEKIAESEGSSESLRIRCRIGRRRVPCWLWFLIVIIIIIIIILTKNPPTVKS